MIALAPVRPHVENPEPWHERLRQENNIVSYIAASLNFALATMLRSNEPGVKKDIRLIRSVRGEHPLPTTRLTIADRQVRIELDDPEIRDRLWPNAPDQASIILQGMVFHATFLALDTISRSWRDGVDQSRTGALAPNLEYALRDDDLNESLEYLNATNLEKASAVMFATGLHGKRSLRNRLNSLAWMIRSWGSTIFSRIGLGKKGEFRRDYPCEVEMVIPPTGAGVDLEAMRTIAQRFDHSEQTSAELGMGTIRWRFKTSEDAAAFLEAIARSQSAEVKE
jgi:hypothetical protein